MVLEREREREREEEEEEREREREGPYQRSWGHFLVILKLEFMNYVTRWCLMNTRTLNKRSREEELTCAERNQVLLYSK